MNYLRYFSSKTDYDQESETLVNPNLAVIKDESAEGGIQIMSNTDESYQWSYETQCKYATKSDIEHVSDILTSAINELDTDKADKSDIPTSLPADGGNADTLDNMHAENFAYADHTHAKYISKEEYKNYIGISTAHPDYNKIIFITDGSGIISRGVLYVNNPFWIKIVDDIPEEKEDNTLYFIKE